MSRYLLCKLVYGDKQVHIAPGRSLERFDHIKPLDRKQPRDEDHLECLSQQVGLSSVVLTPFVGAHNMFSIGYYGRLVEALLEHVFD